MKLKMSEMTAKEYMHIQNRICNHYKTCHGCPVRKRMVKDQPCIVWICENFEEFTSIVRQWAEEHPEKTIMSDFFEKYPNAPKLSNGVPETCPSKLGYDDRNGNCVCPKDCIECWSRPLEG